MLYKKMVRTLFCLERGVKKKQSKVQKQVGVVAVQQARWSKDFLHPQYLIVNISHESFYASAMSPSTFPTPIKACDICRSLKGRGNECNSNKQNCTLYPVRVNARGQ